MFKSIVKKKPDWSHCNQSLSVSQRGPSKANGPSIKGWLRSVENLFDRQSGERERKGERRRGVRKKEGERIEEV